jgi:hypothetical protein
MQFLHIQVYYGYLVFKKTFFLWFSLFLVWNVCCLVFRDTIILSPPFMGLRKNTSETVFFFLRECRSFYSHDAPPPRSYQRNFPFSRMFKCIKMAFNKLFFILQKKNMCVQHTPGCSADFSAVCSVVLFSYCFRIWRQIKLATRTRNKRRSP